MIRKSVVFIMLIMLVSIFSYSTNVFSVEKMATKETGDASVVDDSQSSVQMEEDYQKLFSEFHNLVKTLPNVNSGALPVYRSTLNNILLWSVELSKYTGIDSRFEKYSRALKFDARKKNSLSRPLEDQINENIKNKKKTANDNANELISWINEALENCEEIRMNYLGEEKREMQDVLQSEMAKYLENNENLGKYNKVRNMLVTDYSDIVLRLSSELGLWDKKPVNRPPLPSM